MLLRANRAGTFAFVAVILAAFVSGPAASGEEPCRLPCDCRVVPTKAELRYRLRDDRCEGFFEIPIRASQFGVRLVSFVTLPYRFRSPGGPIQIQWPATDRTTHLKVEPRQPRMYYRMDRYARPNEHLFVWPSNVLKDVETSSNDLGVTVSADAPGGDLLFPATITQGEPQSPEQGYQVTWLVADDAESMTMVALDGAEKELPDTLVKRKGPFRAGTGVSFYFAPKTVGAIGGLKVETTWRQGQGHTSDVFSVHIRLQ